MNPAWRDRILAGIAAVLAIGLSYHLAEGSLLWPVAVAVLAAGAILVRLTKLPLDALTLGLLLIGYIVGNRGFAQLSLVPGLPLLPAEVGLAFGGACLLLSCARTTTLPWRSNALDYALLAWLGFGTARIVFDFPRHGFLALRDYAMVYYAGFFFIAQHLARDARQRRFLVACLLVASVCLPPAFALSENFPELLHRVLAVQGVPLIFHKGDLAPLFMALGAVLLFLWASSRQRWWARPLATGLVVWVCLGENRAAIAGLLGALGWITLSRHRLFPATQAAVLLAVLTVVVALATIGQHAWSQRRLSELTDRAMSVVDVSGRFAYRQEHGTIKSDNNQFRWVWWRTVVDETVRENPLLGLGFGHDLARGFLQTYNPEMAEDFTARSPHNMVVTTFGRLGLVGVALYGWILALMAIRTWRVVRAPASDGVHVALWAALWAIAISACLGVVLEGPMGAVVFWTLLGLAQAYRSQPSESGTGGEAESEIETETAEWEGRRTMETAAR